mmetsp:Transcript_8093/g.12693  ORF Transcript_8093/g.12693 Transcript_8093/m.12693 type:complete len:421 (+) Transcript_8093:57-1319(+)
MMNKPGVITNTARILIDIAQPREGWKSFQFTVAHFLEYMDLSSESNDCILTPKFSCRGHQWSLRIFPGGDSDATAGFLSVYLDHYGKEGGSTRQKSKVDLWFNVSILDIFGNRRRMKQAFTPHRQFESRTNNFASWGFQDFVLLSDILDESQFFFEQGRRRISLTFVVSIKELPTAAFVPKNPFQDMMQKKFLHEESSDLCFEVSATVEPNEKNTRRTRSKLLIPFYAHRFILEICAPMLAELFGEESAAVTINDIKSDVFHQMLWYVYGGTVPERLMKEHAKDIIDAADKFSIVNLKLEAEAAYVKSTTITADNVMDNLLYADAKNLAVLKEAAMDFLAARGGEVIGNVSFAQFPPQLVSDLLVATTRRNEGDSGNDNNFTTMRVSELRRKLHEKGLGMNIDGSRETMIEALRNCAAGN